MIIHSSPTSLVLFPFSIALYTIKMRSTRCYHLTVKISLLCDRRRSRNGFSLGQIWDLLGWRHDRYSIKADDGLTLFSINYMKIKKS
ncbi:hypothetical protein BLOT_009521 [Blomia tropicalis]|nr:hypothetical protein BLOT_009521 [Blomia tropicalis]